MILCKRKCSLNKDPPKITENKVESLLIGKTKETKAVGIDKAKKYNPSEKIKNKAITGII